MEVGVEGRGVEVGGWRGGGLRLGGWGVEVRGWREVGRVKVGGWRWEGMRRGEGAGSTSPGERANRPRG